MKIFSQRLRELRGDMSQVSAARKAGISQQAWAKYETNCTKPSAESIINFVRCFGVSADWLLGLSDRRDGGVTVVPDPELIKENAALKTENAALKAQLLHLQGEVEGLNRALNVLYYNQKRKEQSSKSPRRR